MRYPKTLFAMTALLCFSLGLFAGNTKAEESIPDILDLDLEALLDIQIVSVSKRAQSSQDVAAAIFVITAEDLQRSGATSIAEALRMVPGLHVGRIDSNKWAITSRGFNGRFSNKLLVLIDGRSVYTNIFSGVYWELLDLMLEDLDRIEIIRGPGATMWGANAVNGVINVITKHAADSQGTMAMAIAGSHEKMTLGTRHGAKLGDKIYARVSLKSTSRDEYEYENGDPSRDDWTQRTASLRLDAEISDRDAMTIQSHIYDGDINQITDTYEIAAPHFVTTEETASIRGGGLRFEWRHTLSPTSELSVQGYFDRMDRKEFIGRQEQDVYDAELRHRFQAGEHLLAWGMGYRSTTTTISNSPIVMVQSPEKVDKLLNTYIQDDFELIHDRLGVTLGSKIEFNDYTDEVLQPSARLLWKIKNRHRAWASVSRAVRTPSRAEDDFRVLNTVIPASIPGINPAPLPVAVIVEGNEDYKAEELLAHEVGYRYTGSQFNVDLTLFRNNYHNLRTTQLLDPVMLADRIEQTLSFTNDNDGRTYGTEIVVVWSPRSWFRCDASYALLQIDIENKITGEEQQVEESPQNSFLLRTEFQLPANLELDAWFRTADQSIMALGTGEMKAIDGITTMDIRLGWKPSSRVRLSLVGQNLLDQGHLEFIPESFTRPTLVLRSWYAKATVEF